jgi:hypothetical protein
MSELYRVYWKAVKTGQTGNANKRMAKRVAQALADAENRRYGGLIDHWIELVPEAESLESEIERERRTR